MIVWTWAEVAYDHSLLLESSLFMFYISSSCILTYKSALEVLETMGIDWKAVATSYEVWN